MPVLTLEEKERIIGHLEAVISTSAVTETFKRRWWVRGTSKDHLYSVIYHVSLKYYVDLILHY